MEVSAKLVRNLLPSDYRKRTVNVDGRGKVTLSDCHWSGGTRSVYRAINLATGTANDAAMTMAPWEASNPEGKSIEIPAGLVIVETGMFCGKECRATIHCNPADMPRMLPA